MLLKTGQPIQEMISKGELSYRPEVVLAIRKIPDRKAQLRVARKVVSEGMRVDQIVETANQAAAAGEKTAALKYANVQRGKQPRRWEAFQQLEELPSWQLIVASVDKTCDCCLLRDVASREVCDSCGLVVFLRSLVEAAGSSFSEKNR